MELEPAKNQKGFSSSAKAEPLKDKIKKLFKKAQRESLTDDIREIKDRFFDLIDKAFEDVCKK